MVDEKQIVYSKESIVDIVADQSISQIGTVDISGGQITLGPQSSVSYEYNYEAGQDSSIITDILQLDCSAIGLTDGMTTRYNRHLSILIKVQYYLEIVEGETKTYYDGNTDNFEIYPYLSHESNNTLYNITLQNSYIKKITITYKNNYSNDSVKYTDIKLKYSMSLLEAIDKYGGGSPFVPGSDSLKFYSVEDKYSIDSYGDSLIMKIGIDESNWEEVVKPYIKPTESTRKVYTDVVDNDSGITHTFDLYNPVTSYTAKIRWTVRSKSDNNKAFSVSTYGNEQIVYVKENRDLSDDEKTRLRNGVGDDRYDREYNRILNSGDCWSEMSVSVESRYCKIIGYQTDTLVVRAEYIDAPNIYFEQEIKINNCNIVDFKLTFDDNDMEIHGSDIQFATLDIIPSNIKTGDNSYAANLSCISYDEMGGQASIIGDDGTVYSSLNYTTLPARVKIRGRNNGKVLFTAKSIGLYPADFSKSWIAEVFDVTEYSDLYTRTPNGKVIDVTKEYIDIIVGTNRSKNLNTHSNYGLESLDGVGQGYVTLLTGSDSKELTYRVYPVAVGKIKFWGNMQEDYYGYEPVGRVEVEVDITALYKELTTEITTNTGLFEITQCGGQLEVHCTPNYSYAGGYSFSQVSIDGGSVSIDDKGDYALITADREGRLNLICKPDRGKSVQREISISNQYPENVQLTTATGEFKVALGGQLTVYAESENTPRYDYDRYNWTFDKLYPDSNVSQSTEYKYTQLTGSGLGKIMLNCIRQVDNKLMTSAIIKIVQSLDSDKTVINYPDTYKYWVLYRVTTRGNKVYLLTINDTVTLNKLILKSDTNLYTDNVTLGAFKQYSLNGGVWSQYGSWSGGTNCAGSISVIYASNLPIYDESNNIIINESSYNDIDWNLVLYGE